ncbi:MAG: YeeE/YedE family protein [Acidimicrobiales bacterium]|nr:YeeE/YedE family protein [Acidimicrobiales bacterium]
MMDYWPWWAGALALATITVLYHELIGRRFGVSSSWERVVHWKIEKAAEEMDAQVLADKAGFEAALREATMAEFGAPEGGDLLTAAPPQTAAKPAQQSAKLPLTASATLLSMILVGSFVAAVMNGRFQLRADMGPDFADIVVNGPLMWPTLFVGGVMVGIGTRMAGGCSSGHGMSGCSRLHPVSLLATSVFFGTAVAVSLLLWKVI